MRRVSLHQAAGASALAALLAVAWMAWGLETRASVTRHVRFAICPSGARLAIDGRRVAWFGAELPLEPGAHDIDVDVPGSRCCFPLRTTVRVERPPPDEPGSVQDVVLRLRLRPARVVLVGAPCGASLACPDLGLFAEAGELALMRLPHAQWSGRCLFARNDGRPPLTTIVTLRSGETNTVAWPSRRATP